MIESWFVQTLSTLRELVGYEVVNIAVVYTAIFITTMPIASVLLGVALLVHLRSGWRSRKTRAIWIVAVAIWFSPSIVTLLYALFVGAPWPVYLFFLVIMGQGLKLIIKKLPHEVVVSVRKVKSQVTFLTLLFLCEYLLKVVFLAPDDDKALAMISRFRGLHVTWVENSNGGLPRDVDEYDLETSTLHVAVFVRMPLHDWLVGYGRLLFGGRQLRTKYANLVDAEVIQPERIVEVSRLVVAPSFHHRSIRGTSLSAVIQLLIYRKFFQACEERKISEWWAVLGHPLHRLLRGFGFPFERVNENEGEDGIGVYYAVRMSIVEARQNVKRLNPRLYGWFRRVENQPVQITRINGREAVSSKERCPEN